MIEGLPGHAGSYRGCEIPPDLLYDIERDVWVRPGPDRTLTMGMTDPAQSRAGKFLHIQFKKVGRHLEAGQSAATIETAKWAGPFPSPVAGTIVDTNEAAYGADILIANRDPYGAGWIVRLAPDDPTAAISNLMTGPEAVASYEARIDLLGLNCIRCAD
ncbi:MAG TPA: biotin/lipoyl-containing protein [Candidatus Limnocylindrales bacterium]|nr:biotin/lipoyl-containing protein [Candidatus Limnocylindrales bacterium]